MPADFESVVASVAGCSIPKAVAVPLASASATSAAVAASFASALVVPSAVSSTAYSGVAIDQRAFASDDIGVYTLASASGTLVEVSSGSFELGDEYPLPLLPVLVSPDAWTRLERGVDVPKKYSE